MPLLNKLLVYRFNNVCFFCCQQTLLLTPCVALASSRGFWDHRAARLDALGALIAMRATSLLLVCLLGLGAAANAAATSGAASTAGSMGGSAGCTEHSSSDHGSSHDTSSSNGDAMSVSHHGGSSSSSSSSSNRSGNSGSGVDENPTRFNSNESSPDGSSHGSSGLSWQSLLPGSIQ